MKTYALVIGNNNYTDGEILNNAINDADSVFAKFRDLGYIVQKYVDFKRENIANIISDYNTQLKEDIEVGIFYFAGHAFEVENINYLAPIDCLFSSADLNNCKYYALKLNDIIEILDKSTCRVKIIILDACRNNPFGDSSRGSETIRLAPINVTKGYIIAYSTSPGKTASDTPGGNNSIYTQAFLNHINEKHISIEKFFKNVRETVWGLSNGKQVTWEHTSLIGDFSFNRGQIGFSGIPYDEQSIKDSKYINKGTEVDSLIQDLKSKNWHSQNRAIKDFISLDPYKISKDEQFVLGRNILQAGNHAFKVIDYIDDLENKILPYQTAENENHVLNGILFEIYFDSLGQFRFEELKTVKLDKILSLQKNPSFKKSFEFICDCLGEFSENIFYMPDCSGEKLSVIVDYEEKESTDTWGSNKKYNLIKSIKVRGKDITDNLIQRFTIDGGTDDIKKTLSDYLVVPSEEIIFASTLPEKVCKLD